jgi:hypothetical protein
MTIIKWLLIIAASGYVGLVALLYVMQRSMLYLPPAIDMPGPGAVLPAARAVVLDTSDGEKVIAWHVSPRVGGDLFPGQRQYRLRRSHSHTMSVTA